MAMSDDEKRARDRERKRRQRAAKRANESDAEIPRIGLAAPAERGTQDGTDGGTPDESAADAEQLPEWATESVYQSAKTLILALEIPIRARPLVPLLLRLSKDLDSPMNVPQRGSISARYQETLDRILAASKTVELDPLEQMRREYYKGEAPGVDVDEETPERNRRSPQKRKA